MVMQNEIEVVVMLENHIFPVICIDPFVVDDVIVYRRNQSIVVVTMSAVLQVTLKTISSVEFIIGILGNAFMALVNTVDWMKRGKISAVDKIHTALAISRIAFLLSVISIFLVSLQNNGSLEKIRMQTIPWTVTNHFSVWLATCLSMFYFLKIANFSNSLFRVLKWKVNRVVSVTLALSLIILFINIIVIKIFTDRFQENTLHTYSSNNTVNVHRLFLLINSVFTLIPFTMSLIMFLLLIFSLWRHLKNMQHNATGSRDVRTMAHIKSLQTVVTFLLLYTGFFMSLLLQSLNTNSQYKNLISVFLRSIGIAFPSCHSCVLILANGKLRQAFLSVMWWLRYKHR
ncbi:taste receptor type 2 member 103-like [Meriones unguiculatus]|uniref:taste receptor type 2 member 103-like n=1 Tax=Meriones unguiculatus TaxID=10047 RepID=UPI000B4F9783|nr:taste receptor type 2 member 103-like [Meriones unguiculatus]